MVCQPIFPSKDLTPCGIAFYVGLGKGAARAGPAAEQWGLLALCLLPYFLDFNYKKLFSNS
jgi:hypothetical protein